MVSMDSKHWQVAHGIKVVAGGSPGGAVPRLHEVMAGCTEDSDHIQIEICLSSDLQLSRKPHARPIWKSTAPFGLPYGPCGLAGSRIHLPLL